MLVYLFVYVQLLRCTVAILHRSTELPSSCIRVCVACVRFVEDSAEAQSPSCRVNICKYFGQGLE